MLVAINQGCIETQKNNRYAFPYQNSCLNIHAFKEYFPSHPLSPHPRAVPEAELELETPRFIVRIRIRGTKCRLMAPEVPELKAFLDAPGMRPGHLIMELERAGQCLARELRIPCERCACQKLIRCEKKFHLLCSLSHPPSRWTGLCLSPRNGDANKAAFVDGKEVAASSGDGKDDPHTSKTGVTLKSRCGCEYFFRVS